MLSQLSSMSQIKFNYQRALYLALISASTSLIFTPLANAQRFPDGSTPKFFICPKRMTRFATFVTTKHDINICGKEGADPKLLALRLRKNPQDKVINIPILSSQDSLYVACTANGTYYKLYTNKKILTIQPKKGKILEEKVIASD